MDFFDDGATLGSESDINIDALKKSLSAGYGTNSAAFTGGRAIIPEDCETEVKNLLAKKRQDCKVVNTIQKVVAKSTVHEVPQRIGEGESDFLAILEGEEPAESVQQLRRTKWDMKYLGCKRGVTRQMEIVDTFENAYAAEKIAGTDSVIMGVEKMCFSGNSKVIPASFDGFEASLRYAPKSEQNIISLRGKHLKDAGEQAFDDIAMMCHTNGGVIDKALFPLILAKEVKYVMWDKFRFAYHNPNEPLPSYSTASGAKIDFDSANSGADKFFSPKTIITVKGNHTKRPAAPASVKGTIVAPTDAGAAGSEFSADDKGGYYYIVHAVNQYGISEGVAATATGTGDAVKVAVDTRGGVQLVIKAGTGAAATGYIICRSAKDATDSSKVMEMTRIPAAEGDTTFVDLNHDLPGTASMLFLPNENEGAYALAQLMPVSVIPLPYAATMTNPFLVAFFGALEVRAPQFCGLITDIGYDGGLY